MVVVIHTDMAYMHLLSVAAQSFLLLDDDHIHNKYYRPVAPGKRHIQVSDGHNAGDFISK
jgi:hypothetical protein